MYEIMKENTQNHLIGIGKATCKLGDLKECDGTHSERSAWKEDYQQDLDALVAGVIREGCL